MVQISAVIITFNEEKNIKRCLDSLKDIMDEIVVVDSYSTDSTVDICNKMGAKVVQHTFEGHIQQKNWAITQATYPHVLSLDADEVLSDTLRDSILSAKKDWNADGFTMNRMTSYGGKWIKHGGWYPDKKLRLWDSRKGEWAGVNPHDKYIMTQASKIQHLKGDILHYTFHSLKEHTDQVEKFTTIAANALFKQGKQASFAKLRLGARIKFVKDYIIRLGFLDGYEGYQIAKISAYATFIKYAKLRELNKIAKKERK